MEGFTFITQEYLLKLAQPKSVATIIALILLAVIFSVIRKNNRFNTRMLTYGALAIAASFVLSYVKILQFPNGGSITVASMLPLFVFAYIAGPRAGLTAGLCYGLLQFIQDPFFVHWVQFLLDYPIAFALLGISGFFKEKMLVGAITASMARLFCHFIAGVVFFASYANGQNVFLYSLIYNLSYIIPDMVICLVILMLPNVKAMIKRMNVSNVVPKT